MKKLVLILFVLSGIPFCASSQNLELAAQLGKILDSASATVGVSVRSANDQETVGWNENVHFPMQSVFKFPIAVVVLSEIDRGNLKLDQKVTLRKKDLPANTWSPIRDKYPNGVTLTIGEVLQFTVSQSDNIGCDILLKLLGGPKKVYQYLIAHGFSDIVISKTEADMHRDWNAQFQNWCTPAAMTNLLEATWNNTDGLLSTESHAFLWKIMAETNTGPKRLKGLLPVDAIVSHKTGSSGSFNGITAATNDVGLMHLPNGRVVYISVFVSDSKESDETNERIIAEVGKLVWDYYSR